MGCQCCSNKHHAKDKQYKYSDSEDDPKINQNNEWTGTTHASDRRSLNQYQDALECASIRQRYKILDIVGQGKFGMVYKAESKIDKSMIVAIKVIKHEKAIDKQRVIQEMKILKGLDHPNIIKYYEEIEEGPFIFIVTEYCSGGELLDRIIGKEVFNESEAATITEKLLCALNHCHNKNIAHRDIKPENILYSSKDEHSEVKLIDFGLAKKSTGNSKVYDTIVGTPCYLAPEVLEGTYTNSCDIWSLGVVLHLMLSGNMPFEGNTAEDIYRNIKQGKLSFADPVWEKVTPPGKDLLFKLLEPDEKKRVTASEALKHEWFRMVKLYSPEIDELDRTIMKSMKNYQGTSKFQKACMNIFVKSLKEEEIDHLVEVFNALDKEKNGYIGIDELLYAFNKTHPAADIKSLIEGLDLEGHGAINYSQFIASTLDAKKFLTNEKLWALFHRFDILNLGYLTAEEIRDALNHSGEQQYTTQDIVTMLKEHKIKATDHITFPQFAEIMCRMKLTPEEHQLERVYK